MSFFFSTAEVCTEMRFYKTYITVSHKKNAGTGIGPLSGDLTAGYST